MAVQDWVLAGSSWRIRNGADQGLATVVESSGRSSLVYRGGSSVPKDLQSAGWSHIGDPDSASGYIFDCFQGPSNAKLFTATDLSGHRSNFVHSLDLALQPAEQLNNSYVAVAPGGQWMLSGEWLIMQRLLVYPTPMLNPSAATPGELPLAAVVKLDRPVCNVQGAVFIDERTIVCSTNDLSPAQSGWPVPQQLLQIELDAPLDGSTRQGTVTCLGRLPGGPPGVGESEVEGCDYDHQTGDLRVVVAPRNPLGELFVVTYRYRRESPGPAPTRGVAPAA